MALPPLAIASTLPEIHLAWAKSSYIGKLHTIQLNYLYTAASEAIFSGSRGGAAYGGVQAVSRSEKGTRRGRK